MSFEKIAFHLTHRRKPFGKVVGKKFFGNFYFSFSPSAVRFTKMQKRQKRKNGAAAEQQGLGKALPNKIDHKRQNERKAKFGTVVESCSNDFRQLLFVDF